ncbi:MAG: hypothetical protein ACRDOK_28910 [Streptosporangiaceae bacterium]
MPRDSEYRYSPDPPAGMCPEHPACIIRACQRFFCSRHFHVALTSRGQPRRYCSPACRVAEHRRLRG